MTIAAYIAGVLSIAIVVAAAALTGLVLRRRLLPEAGGAIAAVVVAVGATTYAIVLGEVLGSFGGFRRGALVGVSLAAAIGCALLLRRLPAPPRRERQVTSISPPGIIAGLCTALVLAESLAAIRLNGSTGILNIDALQYHLTTAAHFATTHRTTSYVHVSVGNPISYYPFNAELLHGMGMVLLGRDSLSLLLGTVDIGLVLLAAYAFGDEYDVGPAAVCAVSPMLALFGRVDASALNDWASIWPLLAAAALMLHGWRRAEDQRLDLPLVALAGLGLGLAAGAKADLLIPVVITGLALLIITRRRVAGVGVLLTTSLLSGGYWYVRDFVKVGSPLPSQHIPGLPRIPMSIIRTISFTVAHYLTDSPVWHHFFIPGLHQFFGPAWIPLIALLAAGMLLALARRDERLLQILGVVAILCVAAYLVTPGSALGPPNAPYLFGINIRYALPALMLGAVLLAVCIRLPRWSLGLCVVLLGCLIATATGKLAWSSPSDRQRLEAVAVAVVVVGIALQPQVRRRAGAIGTGAALVLVVAGYPLQQHYLRDRYTPTTMPSQALFKALARTTGLRIGVVGIPAQYQFLGPTFDNTVTYLGQSLPHHAFEDFTECQAWRAAGAHLTTLVVETRAEQPPAYGWTATDPDAHVVFHNGAGTIFTLSPGYATQPCAGN